MKKVLSFALSLATVAAFAQPAKVVNAYNYMKSGELDKAKENIDAASAHAKTGAQAKTWYYKGNIYFSIFGSQDVEIRNLHEDPLRVAGESYKKVFELDTKDRYSSDIKKNLRIGENMLLNAGVQMFNEKQYKEAFQAFETTIFIAEILGVTDTLAIYNAGLAAERSEDYDNAIKYYTQCADMGYKTSNMYNFIVYLYQKQGKDDEALKALKEGREKNPNDQNLIITELNYYLKEGKFEEAESNLKLAIEKDPNNPILFFSIGSVYDNLKKYEEAEKAYASALQLDAEYFDANYNLGALYFNQGVEKNNKANEIEDDKAYKAAIEEVNAIFKKALPYLEKAEQLKPDDRNTLASLKQLYARLSMTDKYNVVNEKLKN